MTPEIKWACICRLEAALTNQGTIDYPQAAHDALVAIRELHRVKADAEFLREEKARVWGAQIESDASAVNGPIATDVPTIHLGRRTR